MGPLTIDSQAAADALVGTTVTGDMVIGAHGLELHDFTINGSIENPVPPFNNIEIHHVAVAGPGTIDDRHAIWGASYATGVHIHHCDISGFIDGIRITTDAVVEYNWIHDLVEWNEDSLGPYDDSDQFLHSDGIQLVRGDGIVIRRNFIDQHRGVNAVSGILVQAVAGAVADTLIEENHLDGPDALQIHMEMTDFGFGPPSGTVDRYNRKQAAS